MTKLPKDFGGIPGHVINLLIETGFDTVESLKLASDEDLRSIDGIGKSRVDLIRKAIVEIEDYADESSKPANEFKWFSGWNWKKDEAGCGYVEFADGTEIKRIRLKRGSNEISVLIRQP